MTFQKLLISTIVGTTLMLSACGGKSSIKLDATDGITLDGTFQEAIEGLEKADQLKAAAGLLIYAYEGAGEENRPSDYIEDARENASKLLDTDSSNIFQSRGEALNNIARVSNGVLNGKSAQDLIDRYNIATEQYDEYLKDKEEAKAEEEARRAAEAEAARLGALDKQRQALKTMQADLSGAAAANKAMRKKLKSEYDQAASKLSTLREQQKAMTGEVAPARGMQRLSNRITGRVTVVVINTTDTPIFKPVMQVAVLPKGQPAKMVMSREAGLYKGEEKKIAIAPGAQSAPMTFPVSVSFAKGSDLSQGGRDFSNTEFQAHLVGYETQGGTKVSLKLDPKVQSILDNYDAKVAKCKAADKAIGDAKTAIPAALKKLDAAGADPKTLPKLAATRC